MLSPHKSQSLLVLQEQGSCHREAPASLTQKAEQRVRVRGEQREGGIEMSRGKGQWKRLHEWRCENVWEHHTEVHLSYFGNDPWIRLSCLLFLRGA